MVPCCRIELLCGLRLIHGDRTVARFITHKAAALLGYLAYHQDRPHLRGALVEMLWPWASPAAGRQNLSTSLSSLRQELEPIGVRPGSILLADRNTVRLNPETTSSDVREFELKLAAAEKAATHSERAQQLAAAIALYRGELLAGLADDWIVPEAERLAEHFVGAAEALADLQIARGDMQAALSSLHHAIAATLFREEPYRRLIRLYAEMGDPDSALRCYGELAAILREHRGEKPSPATQAIAGEIERRRTAAPESAGASDRVARCAPRDARYAPRDVVPSLPTGAVTFLAVGTAPESADPERAAHLLDEVSRRHGGILIGIQGNGGMRLVAFSRAGPALRCAVACQLRAPASRPAIAIHAAEAAIGPGGSYAEGTLDSTRRLFAAANPAQILCSAAAASLIGCDLDSGVTVRDLGTYRLRGAHAPEPLFQIDYPGGPGVTTPLDAEPADVSRLPLQFTRFFGRESEMGRIASLLAGPARLVTLVGAPGCGKTRLAIEATRRVRGTFTGRIWFAPLADLAEGSDILGRALDALGIARSSQATPLAQITAACAGEPALIIFDNFEHLLADGARVGDLLRSLPRVRCLVTSRRRLGLPGEVCLSIEPLPIPAAVSPSTILTNESVELFVDRAQAVRPDFRLAPDNSEAVAEICRRLDGIPLAIELAAARVNVLAPAEIAARLGHGALLTRPGHGEETRHRTFRAAVEWSFDLLQPDLQRFFARLAVFSGGFTVPAAEAVCDEPLAADYLSELAEWSLVQPDSRAAPAGARDPGAPARFGMYASLEECARMKLEEMGADARQEAEERHGRWFARYGTEEAIAALETHGGSDRRKELAGEIENLVVACRRAVRRGDGDTATGTYMALWPVLELQGPFEMGIALGESVLRLPLARDHKVRVLRSVALAEMRAGRMEAARRRLETVLALAGEAGVLRAAESSPVTASAWAR